MPAQDKSAQPRAQPVSWRLMIWIVMGSMFSVGPLSLPGAFNRLGWGPGVASVLLCAAAGCYSGLLYSRLLTHLPWVSSYHELSARAFGPRWGVPAVAATVYLAIFCTPAVLHLACTQALQQVFGHGDQTHSLLAGFVIAAIISPLVQVRSLAKVGWLAAVGSAAMSLAVLMLVLKLSWIDPPVEGGAQTHTVEHKSFLATTVGVLNVVFVFSGQENWVRYATDMAANKRHQFSWSTASAIAIMTPLVLMVGASGYHRHGGHLNLSDPITRSLVPDAWSVLINAAVLLAALVSYIINANVATQVFLQLFYPEMFITHEAGRRIRPAAPPAAVGAPEWQEPADLEAPLLISSTQEDMAGEQQPGISTRGRKGAEVSPAGAPPPPPITDTQYEYLSGGQPSSSGGTATTRQGTRTKGVSGAGRSPGDVPAAPAGPSSSSGDDIGRAAGVAQNGGVRLLWAIVSMGLILAGWMVGYIWPRFAEVDAVVSSLGGITALLLFPALFAIRILPLHRLERHLCWALCGVSGVGAALGVLASCHQLVHGVAE